MLHLDVDEDAGGVAEPQGCGWLQLHEQWSADDSSPGQVFYFANCGFNTWTNRPPDCSRARLDINDVIKPTGHRELSAGVINITDPDNHPIRITIDSIEPDEPENTICDGDTEPDTSGVGTSRAHVIGERQGCGDGRTYIITFTATDEPPSNRNVAPLSCQAQLELFFPHDQGNGQSDGKK